MNKTEQGFVETNIENGIATIEFFHPSHNSLPGRLLSLLVNHINDAGNDETVKVIVLKSGGDRTFCAGASFDELISIEDFEQGKKFFLGFANVINAMRKCPKIIIGRVQGKAVGGGVGLASGVDYCMATKYGSIKLSELAIGIGPFVIGPAVERKIGVSAYSQMGLDATKWQTAEWGKQRGLYTEIFESAEDLDKRVLEFSSELATYNPEALQLLKKVFWEGTDHWDELLDERAAMSGKLVLSDFTRNAIQKFKNK